MGVTFLERWEERKIQVILLLVIGNNKPWIGFFPSRGLKHGHNGIGLIPLSKVIRFQDHNT